jgi:hypothetical protein
MIVCSVAFTGLVAGIVAVPAGVYLHHGVVPVMAHAANSGYPPSLISAYSPWEVASTLLADGAHLEQLPRSGSWSMISATRSGARRRSPVRPTRLP